MKHVAQKALTTTNENMKHDINRTVSFTLETDFKVELQNVLVGNRTHSQQAKLLLTAVLKES